MPVKEAKVIPNPHLPFPAPLRLRLRLLPLPHLRPLPLPFPRIRRRPHLIVLHTLLPHHPPHPAYLVPLILHLSLPSKSLGAIGVPSSFFAGRHDEGGVRGSPGALVFRGFPFAGGDGFEVVPGDHLVGAVVVVVVEPFILFRAGEDFEARDEVGDLDAIAGDVSQAELDEIGEGGVVGRVADPRPHVGLFDLVVVVFVVGIPRLPEVVLDRFEGHDVEHDGPDAPDVGPAEDLVGVDAQDAFSGLVETVESVLGPFDVRPVFGSFEAIYAGEVFHFLRPGALVCRPP